MPESNLRFTKAQEQELIGYLDQRIDSLLTTNKDRFDADKKSERAYERDMTERLDEPIFQRENHNIPLTSLVVDHFATRSEEEITGAENFFNTRPKGGTSPDESMATSRFLRDKLDGEDQLRNALNQSYRCVFTQQAVPYKAVHKKEVDEWEEHGRIALFDRLANDFVRAEGGEYLLYGEIEWLQDAEIAPNGEERPAYVPKGATEAKVEAVVVEAEPGDPRLEGTQYTWVELDEPITRRTVLTQGPRSLMIEADRFLAPMNVASLDDADIIVEWYDRSTQWVRNSWLEAKGRPAWKDVEAQYKNGDASEKSDSGVDGGDGAGDGEGHRNTLTDERKEGLEFEDMNPMHRIYEIWLVRPIKKGGKAVRYMIRYDRKNQQLIYYEYASVMLPRPKMRHPYTTVSLNPKPNRWWGPSLVELIEQDQMFIDRQFCRYAYRNSIASNPIIKYDPEKTVEQKEWRDVHPFEIITPQEGVALGEILEAFVFPAAENNTKDLIERVIFFVQLWLGISNLAQGDSSQMPANPTAFGQDMMLREAGKLSKRWSRRIISGIESHVEKLAYIALDTMSDKETFIYSDGNEDVEGYLERQQVESASLAVELVVAKEKTQMTIEANRLSEELILKYMEMDPITRSRVRPLYKKNLIALGYEDVEDLLPMPDAQEILAYHEEQQRQKQMEEETMRQQLETGGDSQKNGSPRPKNTASQAKKPPQTQSPASGPRG